MLPMFAVHDNKGRLQLEKDMSFPQLRLLRIEFLRLYIMPLYDVLFLSAEFLKHFLISSTCDEHKMVTHGEYGVSNRNVILLAASFLNKQHKILSWRRNILKRFTNNFAGRW